MIPLERKRTTEIIPSKFRNPYKKRKDKELMIAHRAFLNNPGKKIVFKSSFWKTAKTQLKKESNNKCAYCEANTALVAHGDVEHYRPKDTYWWLAYTYDNFLYACQICNQSYKSDNFPIESNQYPPPPITVNTTDQEINQLVGNISPDPIDITLNYGLQRYIDEHRLEMALLLNPYFDDPTAYFAYEADDTIEEVRIIPSKPEYFKYVEAAEKYYGINRIELKNARYSIYRIFRILKTVYPILPDIPEKNEIKNRIHDMLSDRQVFAGMTRYFDNKI
ncbi:MAG: hypothetical protein HUU01_11390 [Saprospiraceae bacterium]|nr:hypothetical protein [Saprospiraceae bacterium]